MARNIRPQADMLIEPANRLTPSTPVHVDMPESQTAPSAEAAEPARSRSLRAIAFAVCIVFSGLVWAALATLF